MVGVDPLRAVLNPAGVVRLVADVADRAVPLPAAPPLTGRLTARLVVAGVRTVRVDRRQADRDALDDFGQAQHLRFHPTHPQHLADPFASYFEASPPIPTHH